MRIGAGLAAMAMVLAGGGALLGAAANGSEGEAQLAPPQELSAEASAADLMASVGEARGQLCGVLEDLRGAIREDKYPKGQQIDERMTGITGLSQEELDAKYQSACAEAAEGAGIVDLVNDHIVASWMLRAYSLAMEEAHEAKERGMEGKPEASKARQGGEFQVSTMPGQEGTTAMGEAQGGASEAMQDYREIHGAILQTLQDKVQALEAEGNLNVAQEISTFFNEVLLPHEKAQEEAIANLPPQDPQVQAAVDNAQTQREDLRAMVQQYDQAVNEAEQGKADAGQLATMARSIHDLAAQHFETEETQVVQPMVEAGNAEAVTSLVQRQVDSVGPWLQEQGWQPR
jgi:hemerythrin